MSKARHILITGGSEGLGQALSQIHLEQKDRLTVLDLQEPAWIQPNQASSITWLQLDLSQSPIDPGQFDNLPHFDRVYCNAGVSAFGSFSKLSWEQQWNVMEINARGHLELLHLLLSRNRIAPGAQLIFTLSATVFTPVPVTAAYAASKGALDGFARAIEPWLLREKIGVTRVYPGQMKTPHLEKYYPTASPSAGVSPARVARRIVRGADRRRRVLYPDTMSLGLRAFTLLFAPCLPWLIHRFTRKRFPDASLVSSPNVTP